MIKTKCPLCGSLKNYQIIYQANFSIKALNKFTFSARRLPDRVHFQFVRCEKDSLVRTNPILEPKKFAKLYKASLFTYSQEENLLRENYLKESKKILKDLKLKDKILEIGCGNGFLLSGIKKLGFKNVYGIEPSEDAFKKANQTIKNNIKLSTFKKNIYNRNSFNLILLFQTLDHLANPNEVLRECFKILKPGGYILSYNHNVESFSTKILKEKSPIIDIEHPFLYSSKTVKQLFEKNHFTILTIFSPTSLISLRHLVWLLPIPKLFKNYFIKSSVANKIIFPLKLGNLCLIAQKK